MVKQRVLLGMSGGTDSSVSAIMLQEKGFEVIGVTFIFSALEKQNNQHINDAEKLANQLNIAHKVVDLRERFRNEIVQRFIKEYNQGKTPFPCAFCNPGLKFHYLNILSKKYNCEFIATGHYANISEYNNKKFISKGVDKEKDQSFFLWGLKNEIINKLAFPLGNLEKNEVRKFAAEKGFPTISRKKDSLGICFIEGSDYRKFLMNNGLNPEPGYFTDEEGNVLGKHQGIPFYTIGQRRGLGLNLNKPLFVSEIKPLNNEIILSEYDSLYKNIIYLNNIHLADIENFNKTKTYHIKIRYRLQDNTGIIKLIDANRAKIELNESVAMVANGQTAVIYDEERVMGGGFIESSE